MADDQLDDEYADPVLTLITTYKEGDMLRLQGEYVEIVSIEETASGLVLAMEDDRKYICSDTRHMHRGRRLKTHLKGTRPSVDTESIARMEDKERRGLLE